MQPRPNDDARGFLVAVLVGAELHHLEAACEDGAVRHVFGVFDRGDDDVRRVLLDRDLDVGGPALGAVTARPFVVGAAMVNDNDRAPEHLLDSVRGLEIGRHVLVTALRP